MHLLHGTALVCLAGGAVAFSPLGGGLPSGLRLRVAPFSCQIRAGMIDDVAPEFRSKTKGQGFDAGAELREKELARRAAAGKEVMGGGASGSSKMEQGQSFEEYMKQRAAASGGKVTDAMGNDITNVKPSYEVVDFMTYMYTPPTEQLKGVGALDNWQEEKSVTGFQKQSTDWLKGAANDEASEWAAQKKQENEDAAAAAEARMQMWLKAAADKKAAEGK